MANIEIRKQMLENGLHQWELADMLDISEFTLCRKLRKELPDDEQRKILSMIKESREAV